MPVTSQQRSVEFKPPSKKTVTILIILIVLFFFFSSLRSIATFYTDSLLFESIGQSDTFSKLVTAKFFVPTIAFVSMMFLSALTIFLATKFGRKNSFMQHYDEWIIPLARAYKSKSTLARNIISIVIGVFFAGSTMGYYNEWILFTHAQSTNIKDPLFKKDIGFYLFELPFIRLSLSWLFAGLVILIIVAFCAHYLNGAVRFEKTNRHITVAAKIHLSILCALAGFAKAAQYYFERFALVHSTRGALDGASYTDVNASLPGLRLLIFVAVIASVLLLVNVYRKGVVLPMVAIALWLIVSIVIGSVYPVLIQNFVVKPSRNAKEQPFAGRNIDATKRAYNLDNIDATDVEFEQGITAETAAEVKQKLAQTLLWDESSLESWFQQQRGEQTYELRTSDRDRYQVGDEIIPTFISAREVNDRLPDQSWQSRHVTYTHGFGAVIARASAVVTGNEPDYLVSDLPTEKKEDPVAGLALDTSRARVYFGEGLEDFVFVGSKNAEQTPTDDNISMSQLGGVRTSNIFKRAAFALRFSDYNILISNTVNAQSKIVYVRDPAQRVKKIAPFLDVDSNPYPIVNDGEVLWIVDAYTSSSQYPYAQYIDADRLDPFNSLNKKINYARNSVKAVVNARTGKVNLYVVDKDDPIIKAYQEAFPKLFTDGDKVPDAIIEHYRYPEDLFNVQSEILADYHVEEPGVLLRGSSRWQVSPSILSDPTVTASTTLASSTVAGGRADRTAATGVTLPPLYQYIAHQEMEKPEFLLTRTFVPIGTSFQMESFLSASSDGDNYGKLRLIEFKSDGSSGALTPTQMIGQINTDKEFSQEATLLDQRGSSVTPGPLQMIPVANTVVYVQPIYVKGQSQDSRPVLTYVTVSVADRTVCAPTIDQAIDALVAGTNICVPFTENIVTPQVPDGVIDEPEPSVITPAGSDDLSSLSTSELVDRLTQASADYEKAKDPLDLGALQKAADKMVELVAELNKRQ